MKILAPIYPIMASSGVPAEAFVVEGHPSAMWVCWPDSCWLLSNRPLFVPDFDAEFVAVPALAAKIGRLGKCVARRFAERYVSEVTAAFIIIPRRALDAWSSGAQAAPADLCFDNAIVIGEWRHRDAASAERKWQFRLALQERALNGGSRVTEVPLEAALDGILDTITATSQTNTLKMGDVILQPCTALSPPGAHSPSAFPIFENLSASILSADLTPDSSRPLITTNFK